jgi:protein TonB
MAYLDDTPTHDPPPEEPARPRYRVPLGLPARDEGRRAGAVISVVIHALIIGLLIIPFFLPSSVIRQMQQGAGGAGPAGGGGGGSRGTGGETTRETLRFVKLARDPVATPKSLPPIPIPVVPPKVLIPPPVAPAKSESPAKLPEQSAVSAPSSTVASVTPGAGGGTGADGTGGTGPGSGGGVGAGIGTGRGSANGPGTGGGTQANYSPQPVAFFLPPLPQPASVRGFKFIAEFDVDSTGRVLDFKFTQTPDGDYNRRIASVLRAMRFRPGTRPDGTPLRMKAQVGFDF